MRVLVFNWKDIRNPEAGGAEVFTHEVAKRWVASGDEVTMFCRAFPGALAHDEIDGVRIVHRGGRLTVYREARRWYQREGAGRFDLVIDEINTRPFMAPMFVRDAPVVALIHQLAAEVWTEETPFPLSVFGRHVLEPRWLRRYREIPTVTVSESTAKDLRGMGFLNIAIVPEGLTIPEGVSLLPKENRPTFLFVGRLVNTKRPRDAIQAFQIIRRQLPNSQLWIIGDGYLRRRIERDTPDVRFFGKVDDRTKVELMSRASLLLMPGVREGFGLVILEAAAAGTPTVGYDIAGVRDAIVHGQTGLLVEPSPVALAAGALAALSRPDLMRGASSWSCHFDWDKTAEAFRKVLQLDAHSSSARADSVWLVGKPEVEGEWLVG